MIDLNTYSLGEAIIAANGGGMVNLMNASDWREIVGYFPLGRCYMNRLYPGLVGITMDTALQI